MSRVNLLLLALYVVVAVSCVTGEKIQNEIKVENSRLDVDERRGARMCVPYDLAMARVEVASAQAELDAGNYHIAEEHLLREKKYAERTTKLADSCIPHDKDNDGVADAADKCPLQPGPAKYDGCPDTDGDGVLDREDKCPLIPGIRELQGCAPAADGDKDLIPDNKDRCPFDPEDKDGYEDQDGCPDTDNDKDGITDEKDQCRDNPGPASNQGCPVNDKDSDGIPDELDKCPDEPEDKDNFEDHDGCPESDNDKDGILDAVDKCPNDKGTPQNNGCPVLDTDMDGVPDVVDKCLTEPEDKDEFEDTDGCPDPDNDKDGVLDADDKCPNEPGVPEEQGCTKKYKLIVVTAQKIELKQTVFFTTGKAVIEKKSYDMLKEVADAIKSVPSIKKVVIEGHTDNVGGRALNVKLSQSRADSVREFLIDEGVDGAKLEAIGYGPDKPISPNKTEKGRAMNRRVEFKIIQ
ncbi:MAG TPA: OmpA family protein [bacterium]|nr:OmpA family protein [bacterium]